jgi:hypothetical protein
MGVYRLSAANFVLCPDAEPYYNSASLEEIAKAVNVLHLFSASEAHPGARAMAKSPSQEESRPPGRAGWCG